VKHTYWRAALTAAAALACVPALVAQEHDHMDMGGDSMPTMPPAPLGVSMNRMGSGTTWIPDAVTVPALERMTAGWHLVLHGFVFGQFNAQGGPRGARQIGSSNWMMLMASRTLAGGRFQARTMLSVDAATVSGRGYPLLLQSGETYQGAPIRDRQHPHDLWMELGVQYERPLSSRLGLTVYAAPAGEPALGPAAFMHRPSAMDVPIAPLSHHWQDATHITFGVLTAGLFTHTWKIEGSVFNGREPDEERWGFDRIRLNSFSGRVTVNPDSAWSITAGYGYIEDHSALEPGESIHRVTASLQHGRRLGRSGQLATALVWGANSHAGEMSHAWLLESQAILDRHNTVGLRLELVRKSAADLVLPPSFASDSAFTIGSLSLGYLRELARLGSLTVGAGVRATVNVVPEALEPVYGSRLPTGGLVYLRIRPAAGRSM
jgi:hypothetical protein